MQRYVRYQSGSSSRYGELHGTTIHPLDGAFAQFLPSQDASVQLADTKLLAPSEPTKIISIGPNFTRLPGLNEPMIWCHPVTCANEPDGIVEIPPGHPAINHECELGIVIGRRAKMVSLEKAGDYIFGFTCFNDITAGDFTTPESFSSSRYLVDGKLFDGFAPFGPYIVTDIDPSNLHMECRVNGQVRQSASTAQHIFSPYEIIAAVSNVMTLLPGDVIGTGSPLGMQPMVHGDVVEVEIENIGVLRNHLRNRQ